MVLSRTVSEINGDFSRKSWRVPWSRLRSTGITDFAVFSQGLGVLMWLHASNASIQESLDENKTRGNSVLCLWLKWSCDAGGSPDEARLEQTPFPFHNQLIWRYLGIKQHFIDSIRGPYYCRGLKLEQGAEPPWPPHFNHCWYYCWRSFGVQKDYHGKRLWTRYGRLAHKTELWYGS